MPDAAMRLVSADTVRERVTKLILTVSRDLPPDVLEALAAARANERSPRGREILRQLLDNAAYAAAASQRCFSVSALAPPFGSVFTGPTRLSQK